jgi:DNA-binding PadR family transcriptional regulator
MMTRLMVLGLLATRSMTGYEIQQFLELSHTDKWAGILPGSIYHALKKMEKESLLAIESVESVGHRTKAAYKITDAGREEYRKLIRETLALPSMNFPTQLYTGLMFAVELPSEDVVAALEEQIAQVEARIAETRDGQAVKEEAQPLPLAAKLVFANMLEHLELHLKFLRELREMYHN